MVIEDDRASEDDRESVAELLCEGVVGDLMVGVDADDRRVRFGDGDYEFGGGVVVSEVRVAGVKRCGW